MVGIKKGGEFCSQDFHKVNLYTFECFDNTIELPSFQVTLLCF